MSDRVAGREREEAVTDRFIVTITTAGDMSAISEHDLADVLGEVEQPPDTGQWAFHIERLPQPVPVGEGQEARLRIVKEAMHRAMMRHDSSPVAPASWDEDAARLLDALAAVSEGTDDGRVERELKHAREALAMVDAMGRDSTKTPPELALIARSALRLDNIEAAAGSVDETPTADDGGVS